MPYVCVRTLKSGAEIGHAEIGDGNAMGMNVAQKLISSHLAEGEMTPGEEIGIRIDQTLTQDATGTLVMLQLEAMGLERPCTEVSVQYVDHNLIQEDFKNADDHLFLESACRRFGIWFSRPGNGVSHPLHQERFGKPGKTLLGSDSHTPAAGSIGMLAMGAGGLEVAMAIAGEPFHLKMPAIWGVELTGELPDWVSAKDVILEMLPALRRIGRVGKNHRILWAGPGRAVGHGSPCDRKHGRRARGNQHCVPIRWSRADIPAISGA